MPQVFKIGPYWVYFWADESKPLEPVHVHVAEGNPIPNATKIWITNSGKCLLCHNKGRIPDKVLRNITRNKMSPTSIGGGGEYHNRRELISPASLKGREEDLPAANLEQWPYNENC